MSYFHYFPIMDNAAMDILIQVPKWMYAFISPRYISRNGIAGSCVAHV